MYELEINPGPTYRLDGEALAIAKELHEYSKQTTLEYQAIMMQVAEYSGVLMLAFDEKHSDKFKDIFQRLANELAIPFEQMRKFHLDATYIDDHNIAFMKQGVVDSNGEVMRGEDQLEMFDDEGDGVPDDGDRNGLP